MKICWDNLEKIHLSNDGIFRSKSNSFIEEDSCMWCGKPYLTRKDKPSLFCSYSCSRSGKNNPFYGKTHSNEAIKIISEANKGKTLSIRHRKVVGELITEFNKTCHPNFKNHVTELNISLYDTYGDILKQDRIDVRPYDLMVGNKLYKTLEVRCYYCGKWYVPNGNSVRHRAQKIRGTKNDSKCNFYCSEECKRSCFEYNRVEYPIISKFEYSVCSFVESIFDGNIIRNDRARIVNPNTNCNLELDIWFPQLNKAIECNGEYWHEKRKETDRIKTDLCKKHNIDLLVISDKDWQNKRVYIEDKIRRFIGV